MRSEYLEPEESTSVGGELAGLAGTLYGFSALEMLSSVRETGKYSVPWTFGKINYDLQKANVFRAKGASEVSLPLTDFMWGKKFRPVAGKNAWGAGAHLTLSGLTHVGLGMAAFTDPIWFAMENISKPLMWPVGVAWFGWKSMARGLQKSRYTSMSVPFEETEGTYTSRQRAVRAISESHLQARSAVGNEAMLFHR